MFEPEFIELGLDETLAMLDYIAGPLQDKLGAAVLLFEVDGQAPNARRSKTNE